MNIRIYGPHLPLTPAIEDYVLKKITPLSRFVEDSNTVCEIEIGKTTHHHKAGMLYKAEANMVLPRGHVYVVAEEADLYQAIDAMRDSLDYELASMKDKRIRLLRKGSQYIKKLLKGFR
jgi:ribosomal subunit interface protein